MNGILQDFVFAMRSLRKNPGFAVISVLVLALGIGANVAIFSLVDEIWLRPMPVPHSERLIRIFTSDRGSEGVVARGYSSYPDFQSIRQTTKSLSGVASLEKRGAQLDTGAENRLVVAAVVSGNFFDVLGPVPAAGRTFTETEAGSPGVRVVMLSHPFWRQQFHADPELPGRTILLDRQQVLVAGILPRGFRGTEALSVPDVWIPVDTWIALTGDRFRWTSRGSRDHEVFARLRPDATLDRARAELDLIGTRLERAFPATNVGRRMTLEPERESHGRAVARLSSILLGIAALVLTIACANVATLLLARAEYRRAELATRVALGATRARLVRQMVSETALLALLAGMAALLLGSYLIVLLARALTDLSFRAQVDAHMSVRVLVFAGSAGALSLLLFGLLPAWQASGAAPMNALKRRGASDGESHARLRSSLVVAQVALSLALAVSGVLMVRSLLRARASDPGFDAHQNMLVLELVPGFGTKEADAQHAFVDEARRRIEGLRGVVGTAVGMRIPFGLSGSGATRRVFAGGAVAAGADGLPIHFDPVSDRFFDLLGTRVVRGRAIDARDVRDQARVIVVNQTMARRLWPGADPVGRRLRLDRPEGNESEVVGVAQDSVSTDLSEASTPFFYTPMTPDDYSELTLIVKTRADPSPLAAVVRRTLRGLNRDVPIIYLASMREHMRIATMDQRLATGLIVGLGAMGLFLAAVGLYGLMAFLVGRRTREIGIRLALGARPRAIFEMVISRALFLTGAGVAAGAVGAVIAARALRSFLFGVGPGDPGAFIAGVFILLAAAVAAAIVPALRATRVDPAEVLKCE